MGRSFAPKYVLHLQDDLGCEKYPTTTSGKIKKNVVKEWVAAHLGLGVSAHATDTSESTSGATESKADIAAELTACWSSVSGLDPQDIKPDMPIRTFTDSTMLIQFLQLAKKQGFKLTLKEVLTANTIEKQVHLLGGTYTPRSNLSTVAESVESPKDSKKERAAAQLGLLATDIEELVPMTDIFRMMAVDRPFPGVWDLRLALSVRRDLTSAEVAAVLETWLRRHELLRSVISTVEGEPPAYAVMHPHEKWLKQQILFGPEVHDLHGVINYNPKDFVDSSYGPLCKATILPLRNTSRCGIVIHIHHTLFDGMVMERWVRDLKHLFNGGSQLNWYPYREFAANYEIYRTTLDADEAVQYFVNKLTGISSSKAATWDIHRVCEKLDKSYSPPETIVPSVTPTRPSPATLPKRFIHLPKLQEMRSRHGISAPIIALAACALINTRYTGADEAIITNLLAGRSWPVEPTNANDEEEAFSPLELSGPTLQNLPARIPLSPTDTALDLLTRVRTEQDEMMLREHVPFRRVYDLVAAQTPHGPADAATLYTLLTTQQFDWLLTPYTPGSGGAETETDESIELLLDTSLGRARWVWLPRLVQGQGHGGKGDVMHCDIFHAEADLPVRATNALVEEFLCAVAWLAEPGNMGAAVGGCVFEGYEVGFASGVDL
ncbi:uncharacterized protein BJX67DRAFT_346709 [Aspergillus lucknowensis]|uniref:Uncharacterized protein n=1 Tax=Aspergillus lucknowensis TaxID=176173 RepID=A0ABR4M075_9EURO